MKEKALEILKPNPVLEMTGQLGMVQHKTFNYFLKDAKAKLDQGGWHWVTFKELRENIGLNTKNESAIKDTLKGLSQIGVQWDSFDEIEGKSYTDFAPVMSRMRFDQTGVIGYKFNEELKDFFIEAYSYTVLSLLIQTHFKSKYALVIWEFCTRYRKTNHGSTGWKELADFKKFLGVEKKYSVFKGFNQHVLKPAIKEINSKSDLYVEVELKRHLRKVVELRFLTIKNPAFNPTNPEKPFKLSPEQQEDRQKNIKRIRDAMLDKELELRIDNFN